MAIYIGFDNPVYISTGNIKSLKVSTDNGTIKSTGEKGCYLIKPEKGTEANITLTGQNYKKTFTFIVVPLQYPDIRLLGVPNDDGMVDIRDYSTTGIYPYYRFDDVALDFKIDSFTIEFRGLTDTISHLNIGALWDSTTKELIHKAKKGSKILIDGVYMSRNGRRLKSTSYLDCYVWGWND